jgi:Reverse transcriptase (RNA-dependent DNA polymerase)
MPPFSVTTLPSYVTCRACDIAKLRRANRGCTLIDPPDLQPAQILQMDIGVFRGPANLEEVLQRKADPKPKIIESRQGFVCYFLVIDRASRYTWVFPLRSKSVPPDLITLFINTHGYRDPALTSPLREKIIRTDGEGSLAESSEFRKLVAHHGYALQKTATDTSSQNGMAERPHQTLGTMTRCLLYSSGMGIRFWADALVYATYLHNRLYHAGIDGIPYTRWTGKRPNLKHIRAFGAKVIVKRSGTRPTKADPHFYDGRFLRFAATEKNLVFFDEVTHREKYARHAIMDEFHYSDEDRPPGAQTLFNHTIPQCATHQWNKAQDLPLEVTLQSDTPPSLTDMCMHTTSDTAPHLRSPEPALHIAAAATLNATPHNPEAVLHMNMSNDMYGMSQYVTLPLNKHPTLGLQFCSFGYDTDDSRRELTLAGCQEGTKANRIPLWRSTLRHSVLRSVNNIRVKTLREVTTMIATARLHRQPTITLEFAKIEARSHTDTDIPQLHFDQLRHIHAIRVSMEDRHTITLTRSMLKKRDDYVKWKTAEWGQHDKYETQQMFGQPIPRPHGATVLPFVWTYVIKTDPQTGAIIYKARATCNGGKRFGRAVTVAETYATCVEQPACRMFWAISAARNHIILGADAGNAFAEAPPPIEPFYMHVDDQFREWWTEKMHRPPIPPGYVLPVCHALQGHPEAPRLWENHIHSILSDKLHYKPTTHEKCLYTSGSPSHPDQQAALLRQVDDFAISVSTSTACEQRISAIGSFLQVPLNQLGVITKFNGVNIQQARWFIKVSCQDYLRKILENHNWLDLRAADMPVPMRSDSAYQRELETATRPQTPQDQQNVQDQAGFVYRTAIGELIYALIVARLEISFATTKLSQYSANPALIHYTAVKQVFAYLNNTMEEGLIYWRASPRDDLPDIAPPRPRSNYVDRLFTPRLTPTELFAYTDSDWGSDTTHRRSVSGMIILLSGAAVIYKTRYQKSIALSSTEAEFVSASETGKMILYIRSLLQDLGYPTSDPTVLNIDNTGTTFMIGAQAPTRRTRHIDIRYFAILDWTTTKQLVPRPVKTDANISDSMTKPLARIKFHQQADLYLGRIPPFYVPSQPRQHFAMLRMAPQAQHASVNTILSFPAQALPNIRNQFALTYPLFAALFRLTDMRDHGRVSGYST